MNLEEAKRLGDRHLMPNQTFAIDVKKGCSRIVRLTASADIASSVVGQHCLWMLTNLLARQFGIITVLEINVPAVRTLEGVGIFGSAPTILECLQKTGQLVAGNGMDVRDAWRQSKPDAEVSVGSFKSDAPFAVAVLADGWRIIAGRPSLIPALVPGGSNAFGAYFAACIGAGEIFKYCAGLKPGRGRFIEQLFFSLWDYQCYDSWSNTNEGIWPERILLDPFYLVGVGAVGQAVVASLAASPNIGGYATLIDNEKIDDTNRNRYILANSNNIEVDKVYAASGFLAREYFEVFPYKGCWEDYVQGRRRPQQREDIQTMERQWKYKRVLSCVDKNTARHSIQNVWPHVILGGSTFECGVVVQAYDLRTDGECLKCANPLSRNSWTIETEVEKWRRMSPEQRHENAESRGLDFAAIEGYLRDPRCGELGEQEIIKFAQAGGRDWSVGFVSVAAGVLLAAKLIQSQVIGWDSTFTPGQALRFSFLNPCPTMSRHTLRLECDCSGEGRSNYRRLWVGD